jgi:hypothetical protein
MLKNEKKSLPLKIICQLYEIHIKILKYLHGFGVGIGAGIEGGFC